MTNKSVAVILLIENIPRYLEQFKLAVLSIREYNNIPIYAITPTVHKLSNDDISWCVNHDVIYYHDSTYNSRCVSSSTRIHSCVISTYACYIASCICDEEIMIFIDNDTICQKNIQKNIYNESLLCLSVNLNAKDKSYLDDDYVNYTDQFIFDTKRSIKLLGESVTVDDIWPGSWFILHPSKSVFWEDWYQYIEDCIHYVETNTLLLKFNLKEHVIQTAEELFLLKQINSGVFDIAADAICTLSLRETKTKYDSIFYNYGGFDQHINRIIDQPVVEKYLKEYDVVYDSTCKGINDLMLGSYTDRVDMC